MTPQVDLFGEPLGGKKEPPKEKPGPPKDAKFFRLMVTGTVEQRFGVKHFKDTTPLISSTLDDRGRVLVLKGYGWSWAPENVKEDLEFYKAEGRITDYTFEVVERPAE